jgi:hypothetical protein
MSPVRNEKSARFGGRSEMVGGGLALSRGRDHRDCGAGKQKSRFGPHLQ